MELKVRAAAAPLIFFFAFFIYLFSSAPELAPYRDMGEMVSVSKTLGIAHPPGYPAYVLSGKLSTMLPFANPSYRVNLVSVLGGALAALFLFLTLAQLGISRAVAAAASLLWVGSAGIWTVSIVTEMYSLNVAGAMAILYISSKMFAEFRAAGWEPYSYLLFFLLGLFCGLRIDMVLLGGGVAAGQAYFLWSSGRKDKLVPAGLASGSFFILGFSIFLYLLIRSDQGPFLNWRSPDTIDKLLENLMRKSHGGTLDLLSVNYKPGELFRTDFLLYIKDLSAQFWHVGLPLAFLGLLESFKSNRRFFILTFIGWFFTGPFFIYKANLPPNPHAYAILEPHFCLPNAIVAAWIGIGLNRLLAFACLTTAVKFFLLIAATASVALRWPDVSKRNNFIGSDYARNMFRSLPPDSMLVMQKDVQLFLFWSKQLADGTRPDAAVIARGLSGSGWYQEMRARFGPKAFVGPLKTESDWTEFAQKNSGRLVFAGWDQDVPQSPSYFQRPIGLARCIVLKEATQATARSHSAFAQVAQTDFLKNFYVYRGRYRYSEQKEFFSSDLIDDYSKGHLARAGEMAEEEWNRSLTLNETSPHPYYRRGFFYFNKGDYARAVRDFEWSEKLQEETWRKTEKYHSLPEVRQAVKSEWAEANLNLGVAYEKAGNLEKSEKAYLKALSILPNFARAHYNIAVLYWNKDWPKVVRHLEQTLQLDPSNTAARAYLTKATTALDRSQSRP